MGSGKGIIYWGEESSISVHWFRFLMDVPHFKCSAMVHVGVCINKCRIRPSNVVIVIYCMFNQCGHTRVTICQCPSVFFNPVLQCPSSFTNIGHITRAAWNPINYMYRCQTLEAWHIRQEPKPMNRDRGLLPPVYDSLIRTHPPSDTRLCR